MISSTHVRICLALSGPTWRLPRASVVISSCGFGCSGATTTLAPGNLHVGFESAKKSSAAAAATRMLGRRAVNMCFHGRRLGRCVFCLGFDGRRSRFKKEVISYYFLFLFHNIFHENISKTYIFLNVSHELSCILYVFQGSMGKRFQPRLGLRRSRNPSRGQSRLRRCSRSRSWKSPRSRPAISMLASKVPRRAVRLRLRLVCLEDVQLTCVFMEDV